MARSAVRLISLDVTNTILRVRGGVGGVYKTIAQDFSLLHDTSADEISTQFREIFREQWKKHPNFGYGSFSAENWWLTVADRTVRKFVPQREHELVKPLCDALYQIFSTAQAYEVIPGAEDTLHSLAKNFELILLTNNDARIRTVIEEMFKPGMFSRLVISNEIGYHKPDERIFHVAYEGYSVPYTDILHIGDSLTNDYKAAKSLGIQSSLIASKPTPNVPEKDRISNINQILTVLEQGLLHNQNDR